MSNNSTNVRLLSGLLSGVGAVSPRAAGRLAFELFCTTGKRRRPGFTPRPDRVERVRVGRRAVVTYAWDGGVGPGRTVVAFSAICAHKLAYPTRDISFIRYQPQKSATSDAHVIHCCADHSVYDPANGARVLAGPAPQPLAAILLDYDSASDGLFALGTIGAEQFDRFFAKYDFKLGMEYGQGKAKVPVGNTTVVRELAQFCKQTVQC